MSLNWNDEDEDLTVVEEEKETTVPHARQGNETIPFARKSNLSPKTAHSVNLEEPTPRPSPTPFPLRRFPLHAALPRDRFAAFFIDTLILAYLNLGLGLLLKQFFFNQPWFATVADPWKLTLRIVALIIMALIYYVLFESIGGATPGKLLCRLRVVDLEGNIPTLANVFLRNLCRLFDYPFLFLVAILSMESSHFYQRLGDRAAHTVVIKKTRKRLIPVDLRNTPVSSTFVRMLAFGVDVTLFGTFIWLYGTSLNPQKGVAFQLMLWGFPFFAACYFMIFEFAVSSTPGKLLLNRQVALDNGEPLDATAAILRNLVLPLDVILGYPLLALTRKKQRLGDLLADTLVIKKKTGRNGMLAIVCLLMVLATLGYLSLHNPNRGWFYSQIKIRLQESPATPQTSSLIPPQSVTGTSNKTGLTPNHLVSPTPSVIPALPNPKVTPPSAISNRPRPSTTSSSLKITEFYLSSGPEPTQIRNDAIFHRGDLIFAFFKLTGFQRGGAGNAVLTEDLQLEGPNGEILFNKPGLVTYSQNLPEGSQHILFANQLTLLRDTPLGTYRLIVVLKDSLSRGQLVFEKSFSIQ
jgi:uncharacterized RDD family membrane protein YckC